MGRFSLCSSNGCVLKLRSRRFWLWRRYMVVESLVPDQVEIAGTHRMIGESPGIHKCFSARFYWGTYLSISAGKYGMCSCLDLTYHITGVYVEVFLWVFIHFLFSTPFWDLGFCHVYDTNPRVDQNFTALHILLCCSSKI